MTDIKQLPKFENEAVLEGVVLESDIALKQFENKNDGSKYNALFGRIVIQTGENESHVAQYFVKELTKAGKENGIFTNVKTVIDELVTLQDIAQGKVQEGAVATKVRVRGEVDLNEYYVEDALKSQVQVKGIFLNRVKDESSYEPKATFDVEGFVKAVKDEFKGEDETGRKIVELIIPTYSGAIPVNFISRSEDADYIEDNFEAGASVNLYGNIINFSKKIEKTVESGFGEAKSKVTYENTREMLITGGSVYDEENPKTLDSEQIKELSTKRNVYLATLKERAQNRQASVSNTNNKPLGFGGGAPTPSATKKPAKIDANLF